MEDSGTTKLKAAPAQLLAWCIVALVNAAVIAVTLDQPKRYTTAIAHYLYDAGHMLCLGLLCYLGVVAWQRWGVRRRGAASAALWVAAFAVDGVMLVPDLVPRAGKLAGGGAPAPWLLLLTAVASFGVVCAAWAGRLFSRRLFRIPAVFGAIQLVVANHFVLQRHYTGVHLQVAWMAATAMGCSLAGARIPTWAQLSQRVAMGLTVAAGLLAAVSVGVRPPNTVLTRMLSRSGSVMAPFVGRYHAWRTARQMRDRYGDSLAVTRLDVPPTKPKLLDDPVVVFLTIDALRADLLERDDVAAKIPNMRRLRDSAVWFSQARTPAPATIVALGSVFSGRYFSQLLWGSYKPGWQPFPNHDKSPRLAEVLTEHGVTTVTYHGSSWMQPDTGVVGPHSEHVRLELTEREKKGFFASADRLADAAVERLAKHDGGPLYIYMHWTDPHAPYDQVTTEGSDFERYLAEVTFCDTQLGRLMDGLAKHEGRGVLILGADHGEAFGEHDSQFHGVTVYDELVRVPLLVSIPGVEPGHITAPVSLLDVGPTVLDLMNAVTPASFMGQSLLPLVRRKRATLERPVIVDSGRHQRALIFDDGMKVIQDRRRGTVELYDLRTDPGEERNLADELEHDTAVRLDALDAFFARHELRREGYETPWRPP